ncbi:serine/threonine-protein kinase [Funiculus sociatus GB2-A5]|uniref:Serine/threonine-protein kinase B n=1 Tax=Funiculus sociatus GB2-A5 TaxID=2933946 RepID=A0ABV0JQ88_9CYAN|nr:MULTISPECIES: serine/threonine-protein kinase [unclassified Trichocoleus]MBD1904405.1 pentapeptide repeat-containing protein [Trichocoleus sp. FACHB-832]MBD2062230.1 pentapeptide repeat-containing protein [Trichocoleus sp. FACHB-6]
MSYCLNPACPSPQNITHAEICRACGSKLLLRKRYRVLDALGQGGFGATFLAHDESLPGEPSCVIKQLRPATTVAQVLQMARELFEREARTLGKIGNHPQVPRLLDYFEDNQQFYLVQEYISGLTLQQEVKGSGPLSEAGVKQFLSEILPVMQYIHSQQVIHRDIKPANLIRREQDRKLVLIDFGAVKNQVNQAASSSEQTALTAYAIGTPGFAPPEQMAMRPVYASDLYALGVTCIYLLTGKSPKDLDYNPTTGEMLWQKHVHISPHFTDVLKKMLEVSVRHRYQSAEEVLRALDLEPYLDTLAQGLTTGKATPQRQPGGRFNTGDLSAPTYSSSPSAGTSTSERLAMAIKARRARLEANDPQTGGGIHSRALPGTGYTTTLKNSDATAGSKGKLPAKLDAVSVLNYYTKGRRDFASQDLSLLNLQRVNLSGAIFHQAKLNKTNLQGADLSNADFGRASLTGAILKEANLGRAYFSTANLEGADLRGADLSFAYLNHANLRGANLCGANLTGAKITEEQLAQAKTNWATVLPSGKRGFW